MVHSLIVLKFGSSVLRSALDTPAAVHEIYRWYRTGSRVVAVVSAIGATTDLLLREARDLANEPHPQATAQLLATGEQQSAALLGVALDRAGIPSRVVDPREMALRVRGSALDSEPVAVDTDRVEQLLKDTPVLVVPGFFGYSTQGHLHLLGRGGSDLTAVYLANALKANRCRLVKDVDGVYDHDPALGDTPRRFIALSYARALQCAAPLVQPKAVHYLEEAGGNVEVAGLLSSDESTIGRFDDAFGEYAQRAPAAAVLLLGLGTVGGGVHRRLKALPTRFRFIGALVRDRTRHMADGVALEHLLDSQDALMELRPDVVVDALPGIEPSHTLVRHFLGQGVPVVSANKWLIAEHGAELTRLAVQHETDLRYSATVGGSAPMLEALRQEIRHGEVRSVAGVLNGSCNYILDACARGLSFDDAVRDAQLHGFAEADPQDDLSGRDAMCKLRILARHAFGVELRMLDMESLTADAIERHGDCLRPTQTVRQVARTWRLGSLVFGQVRLEAVDVSNPLAQVNAEWNRLVITHDDGTDTIVSGRGAGRWPTTEAIIADVLTQKIGL